MSERYMRTRGGGTVHRPDCRTLKKALPTPWPWADDKTPQQVAREAAAHGITYHWCRVCFPEVVDAFPVEAFLAQVAKDVSR